MGKFNEFMKRQAELELEYAAGMHKLIKQHKDEIGRKGNDKSFGNYYIANQSTSFHQAWECILNQMEKIAEVHGDIGLKLENNIRKTVKYMARDNMIALKQRFDDVRRSINEVGKSLDSVEKLRIRAFKSLKDLEVSHSNLTLETQKKKDLDKFKLDFERKFGLAMESKKCYELSIIEANEKQRDHYNKILPEILMQVQKEDEQQRIIFMKTAVTKFNQVFLEALPVIQNAIEFMTPVFENISVRFDIDFFCKILHSKSTSNDIKLFEILDSDSDKRRLLQGDIKSFLDKDEKEMEKLLAYDPKESRKRATNKIKVFEKDIETIKKSMEIMEIMKSYSDETNLISNNILETRTVLERLEEKVSRLNTIIRISNGSMPPESLTSLQPSNIASVSKLSEFSESVERFSIAGDESKRSPIISIIDKYPIDSQPAINIDIPSYRLNSDLDTHLPDRSPDSRFFAKVLYDFEAAPDSQEMTVKCDQILEIIEKFDDGWWRAIHDKGNGVVEEGFVPGNYLMDVHEDPDVI